MRRRIRLTARMVRDLYNMICVANGVVKPPRLVVVESLPGNIFGEHEAWSATIRVALGRHRLHPFAYVVDTLAHELAHEIAGTEEHGEKWQRVAKQLGAVPTCWGLR